MHVCKVIERLSHNIVVLSSVHTNHSNSVEATQARLKELQAEYEQIHQELKETVSEAGMLSTKLRHTLASHKV